MNKKLSIIMGLLLITEHVFGAGAMAIETRAKSEHEILMQLEHEVQKARHEAEIARLELQRLQLIHDIQQIINKYDGNKND